MSWARRVSQGQEHEWDSRLRSPLTSPFLCIADTFFFFCKWDCAPSATGCGEATSCYMSTRTSFHIPKNTCSFPQTLFWASVPSQTHPPLGSPCSIQPDLLHLLQVSYLLQGLFPNTQTCSSLCLEHFPSKNFLSSFRLLLKCHFLQEVFPETLQNLSSLVFSCTFPLSTYQHQIYYIF